jgi:hypothetical protein
MARILALAAFAAATLLPAPAWAAEAGRKPSFEVYGFAQVDYIQDFQRVRPDWTATLRPTRIPTVEGLYGADGESIFSVRQSRLGVRGSLPAGAHDLKARIEFDFFGTSSGDRPDAAGPNGVRLRRAYGEWGPLLGGLTASLFMDDDWWPNIIDYWGPAGMVFFRNVQIRYTPISGEHTFAVAVERPATDLDPAGGPAGIAPRSLFPDLTAQYRLTQGWGYLQVSGILRWLGYDTPGAATQTKGDAIGWGLHASSTIGIIPDKVKLLAAVVYGSGTSYYMNDASPDLAFGGTVADPKAEAVPMLGMAAYLDVYWDKLLSSTIGYSTVMMFNKDNLQGPGAFKTGQYASVNLLVAPFKNFLAGPEFLWGQRTDKGGAYGTDTRLQVSVKYSFSSLDFWKPQ